MNNNDKIEELLKSKKLNKHIKNLQNIVNNDEGGITEITISCGDTKVEFKKEIKQK